MKLINGTVVLGNNREESHIRLHFSQNGEYIDGGHVPVDMVLGKGESKKEVAAALRLLADRVENI